MDRILNFQISLFGMFKNIQPDNEITMRLMKNLQEDHFIPGTVDISFVDAANKKISSESRLQMISEDTCWRVIFLQERIDLNYNYSGGLVFYSDFEAIFNYALKLLKKVFSTFPDTSGNRLAVNGKYLLNNMSIEERKLFIKRFSTPFSVYNDAPIEEWDIRFNVQTEVGVSEDRKELCNNIIQLTDVAGIENGISKKRMLLSLDINTLPEKQDNRFYYHNLMFFANIAKEMMVNTLKEIEEG